MSFRLAVVGTGLKAREYAESWLNNSDVEIPAVVDVDATSREAFAALCEKMGHARPEEFQHIEMLLAKHATKLDAAYIATPHTFHASQAEQALRAGVDVFLEKPMVTTVEEANRLLLAANETRATLVVAFQGGLSDLVQRTRQEIAKNSYGELISVTGMIWADWATRYQGNWKQVPKFSGGGFMFDTGTHLLNTITVLTDSTVERLCAFQANRGFDVDIVSVVAARLKNGVFVTMNAIGECSMPFDSHVVLFFTNAIVRVDALGRWSEVERAGEETVRDHQGEMLDSPLKVFREVCARRIENPSTIENGLRVAYLWDAIKASAARDGEPISIDQI